MGISLAWAENAACAGETDLFFPTGNGSTLTIAKKLCASCPVRQECEDYGMSLLDAKVPVYRGLWGGKSVEALKQQTLPEGRAPEQSEGICELPGCGSSLAPSGSNRPRKYCSVSCKKRAEHKREKERVS